MRTGFAYSCVFIGISLLLASCGRFGGPEREKWRDAEEARCLRAGALQPSEFAEALKPIRAKYTCGLERPFKISALANGTIRVQPAATLGCPVTVALTRWLTGVVQPAAQANFGQPVVAIKNAASYGCRTRNNRRGAKLSEHAFGNALDVRAFFLADGREITVLRGWKGAADERAFLRQVQGGACGTFKTVLGPGSDGFHEDHLHLDLAHHDAAGRRAYCRPQPQAVASAPQMRDPDPDFSPGLDPDPFPDAAQMPMSYAPEPRWPVTLSTPSKTGEVDGTDD
jgi:hypothetical protein